MAARLKLYLQRTLRELKNQPIDSLLDRRYAKFRRMGVLIEQPLAEPERALDTSAATPEAAPANDKNAAQQAADQHHAKAAD